MASNHQRLINNYKPGAGNRLDYSGRQLRGAMPSSSKEFEALMMRAHDPQTGGPGSSDYSDLMALYQAGYDINSFPDASAGGVPRASADTYADAGHERVRSHVGFDLDRVDPLLMSLKNSEGVSLAAMGPEAAREFVTLSYLDTPASQRQQLHKIFAAIENSPTSSMGIEIDYSGASEEQLSYSVPMDDAGSQRDPSAWGEYVRSKAGDVPDSQLGMAALEIRATAGGPDLSGVDMGSLGGGGGEYHSYFDSQYQAEHGGDSTMHQGDAGANTFTTNE